ncbi:UDP-glucuronosyl/UDP-glucosyltransferase [Dillenia turbinata]|uniref:Glycosyltransferase n=1 Tax=Dillenia turbinata TaxID=194707 RepID=A0AAN8VKU1_9MAGN
MGHLIPLIELARKLILYNNIYITFFIPNDGSSIEPQKQVLQALPRRINAIFLPPVSLDDLPEDTRLETRFVLTITRFLSYLRDAFKVLKESSNVTAMVVDLFGSEVFDVANEFGALSILFCTASAMLLCLTFISPELHETYSGEFTDLPEPVQLHGCVPLQGRDLPDPLQDRKNEAYGWMLHLVERFKKAAGIMVNSFFEMEMGAFKGLKEDYPGFPPVYPPSGSVLFVSFGSGGTLSSKQLRELACGLEMSGQRFLWVIRSPHDKAANAAYLSVKSAQNPFNFLPDGFIERTKNLGLVVPSWASQIAILCHGSTGGFLTHCGWNSILESVVHGVPLIAWPLNAEQRLNAVLLSEDLKVAVRVEANEKGLVGREKIAEYIKGLIEGNEGKMLKDRMKNLKEAAAMALKEDGSSSKSLIQVPQISIFNHSLTGDFLTHCDRNSTVEIVVHGIPLIAWPLFAKQRQNTVLLSDDFKVAVRVQANEKVVRVQIAGYVRGLIEGDEGNMLQKCMEDLKEAAKKAMGKDGSPTKLLAEVAQILSDSGTI